MKFFTKKLIALVFLAGEALAVKVTYIPTNGQRWEQLHERPFGESYKRDNEWQSSIYRLKYETHSQTGALTLRLYDVSNDPERRYWNGSELATLKMVTRKYLGPNCHVDFSPLNASFGHVFQNEEFLPQGGSVECDIVEWVDSTKRWKITMGRPAGQSVPGVPEHLVLSQIERGVKENGRAKGGEAVVRAQVLRELTTRTIDFGARPQTMAVDVSQVDSDGKSNVVLVWEPTGFKDRWAERTVHGGRGCLWNVKFTGSEYRLYDGTRPLCSLPLRDVVRDDRRRGAGTGITQLKFPKTYYPTKEVPSLRSHELPAAGSRLQSGEPPIFVTFRSMNAQRFIHYGDRWVEAVNGNWFVKSTGSGYVLYDHSYSDKYPVSVLPGDAGITQLTFKISLTRRRRRMLRLCEEERRVRRSSLS